jgi:uncharacterized protein (TIGR02117 family)
MLLIGLYFAAALIGSLLPVNAGWRQSEQGYEIYLHDNGIHTSIILPRQQHLNDLDRAFPAAHLPGQQSPHAYLMFGWGDRDFYLNTPTWGDLDASTAASAVVGSGETLLHVDHLNHLPSGVKKLRIEHEAYQTILSQIVLTTVPHASAPLPTPVKGYSNKDVFYVARGRGYSILYTCNNWLSDVLKAANIKTSRWTPLPFGVMWWH